MALHLIDTVSLSAGRNQAIHHITLVLALEDADNIPFSEYIVAVCVSFTRIPPPPITIQRYRQLADRGQLLYLIRYSTQGAYPHSRLVLNYST